MLIDSNDVMKNILKIEKVYGVQVHLNMLKDIVKSVVKTTKEKAGK